MENAHLTFAIIFLALAMVLFVVEWFIPSGGILAMSSLGSLAAGVFFLYKVDTTLGLIGAIVSLGALPFLTPIFRGIAMKEGEQRPCLGEHGIAGATGKQRMQSLVGQEGEAVTDLRPVGTCRIKGERMDCLATPGPIRAGAKIRVIAADGMQVKVKEEGT